jgi:hypothetical protein
MPDWTDLKAAIADSWKVSWNVDPLPFSVPERLLDEEPDEELPDVVVLDEELHAAARTAVAMRATPAVVTRLIRKSCM